MAIFLSIGLKSVLTINRGFCDADFASGAGNATEMPFRSDENKTDGASLVELARGTNYTGPTSFTFHLSPLAY